MPKWAKTIIAVMLLPFCYGAAVTLVKLLRATGRADTIWVAVVAGAACWLAVFLILPKPMRLYVFGHELTHAMWTWLFGGRVKKFKVTSKGGQVVVTKNNFLIALAPYFFPLYAALVVLCFVLGQLIWNWTPYAVVFHLLLGAAYAFHITLTIHVLQKQQTDITSQGYFFSAVIIYLGNVSVLLLGIPLLTNHSVLTAMGWWMNESGAVLQRLGSMLR